MVHVYYDDSYYNGLSDEEWIEKLLNVPPIESLHRYFFKVKCAPFLQFIAKKIMKTDLVESIMGEFYEFLRKDDWYVLRQFRASKNASLSTYLSRCTLNYFCRQKQKENQRAGIHVCYEDAASILDCLVATSEDKEMDSHLWPAFYSLKERDRILLYHLVIKGQSAMDVADRVWCYVRSKEKDWRNLPSKRVQSTISMMKQRALYVLLSKLNVVKN